MTDDVVIINETVSPVDFAEEAELGLRTELATGLLPPGGALEEEEEEDLPPSTESSSSKFLSAEREEEAELESSFGSCCRLDLNAASSSFHRVTIGDTITITSTLV